jgi:hypothetical protein
VSEYLPEFQLKDPHLTAEINFVDLLAHRTVCGSTSRHWRVCPYYSLLSLSRCLPLFCFVHVSYY